MAEKAIIKYCKWEINIESPTDFINTIYNNLIIKFKNNDLIIDEINKYKDMSITLLEYAICEYSIFSKYNQIIIALSSCFISLNLKNEHNKENEFNIRKELKKHLDEIIDYINFDKNLLESCSSLISKNLEKEEDEDKNDIEEQKENESSLDINYLLEITRSDSNLSFFDTYYNFNIDDFCSFNNSINNNDDESDEGNNKFINFGKISPISKGELLTKEEKNNNYIGYIYHKKDLINLNNSIDIDNNDNEVLLLKRKKKRNEIKYNNIQDCTFEP